MNKIPMETNFKANVIKTESCWIWTGWGNGIGYGRMSCGNKRIYAHRFSYEKYKGKITNGLNVLHSCDNPSCVNPDHLFLGTQKNNVDDMRTKGRMSEGTKHPVSKITSLSLMEIRREYKIFIKKWATQLNVSNQTIRNVIDLRTYRLSDLRVSINSPVNPN